jgi:tRNA pseudouridine38-40 synthase
MRIAVGLEYDGSQYAGWQSQPSVPSIQSVAEAAIGRVAAHPVGLVCAGRTDAGVHAVTQVAHFDTEALRSAHGWIRGANTYLPADVSVVWARRVPDHFHARYSAERRTYCYFILNRSARSGLADRRAALIHRPLDHARMQEAAVALLGTHDFSAFRSAECQAHSPVRRLEGLVVERMGAWVRVRATANAFLHHMVRNMVGLLLAVGEGRERPEWAREVLQSRDRSRCAATAPAQGLYLWCVEYPRPFGLPRTGPDAVSAMIPGPPPTAP